jgi:ectoine hydroxylase-related dioxygenase (phytanoyl-CoA dioxygenase family)
LQLLGGNSGKVNWIKLLSGMKIMLVEHKIGNIEEALQQLDVTGNSLSEAEKQSLDRLGYVLLPGIIDAQWLDQLRQAYEELMAKEGHLAGIEVHQEAGTRRLSDLVNKGEVFDRVYTHPKVLAGVYHVLGREFKLSSLNGRDALPGYGQQGFHADWQARHNAKQFSVVNSIWLLDDFTPENGATRVVPGSHLLEGSPKDYLADPLATHPEEVLLVAPAGSVGIFNAHLWHGGTTNRSTATRRAVHCFYTARENPQQLNQAEYLRKKTYDRISPAARYILDVE